MNTSSSSLLLFDAAVRLSEFRNEIGLVHAARRAFRLGLPHLAPDIYSTAPSAKWLEMQAAILLREIDALRALLEAATRSALLARATA